MTTLVLGGTGFIGKRAVPRLVQRGEKVIVMDINPGAADLFVKTESGTKKGPDVARALDEEKRPEKPAFFSLPIRSVSGLLVSRRDSLVQIHDDRQQSGDGSPGEPT